ncbi:hypothetical protein Fcan01_22685 [Folsomia candida]|uniref:Uncharacterized protein n=1 Tax=Folsomia candida TaxID=158441 RepID=A0A226DAB6_FOLCA|nr:hypothetical protein Fcan01_22685 [Folsomia candida]
MASPPSSGILENIIKDNFDILINSLDVSLSLLNCLERKKIINDETMELLGKTNGKENKADKLLKNLRDYRTDDDIPVIMHALDVSCNSRVLQIFKQRMAAFANKTDLLGIPSFLESTKAPDVSSFTPETVKIHDIIIRIQNDGMIISDPILLGNIFQIPPNNLDQWSNLYKMGVSTYYAFLSNTLTYWVSTNGRKTIIDFRKILESVDYQSTTASWSFNAEIVQSSSLTIISTNQAQI